MSSARLRIMPSSEGAHRRSQHLLAEAKAAADDHVDQLQRALIVVAGLAADVGLGGEVYPVGVRGLASKIAGEAEWCAQNMQSIMRNMGRASSLEAEAGRRPGA